MKFSSICTIVLFFNSSSHTARSQSLRGSDNRSHIRARNLRFRRHLTASQFDQIWTSEVSDELLNLNYDLEQVWYASTQTEWSNIFQRDVGSTGFLVCDETPHYSGYERQMHLQQILHGAHGAFHALYNSDDWSCFITALDVEVLLLSDDIVLPDDVIVHPINPTMKLRSGVVDAFLLDGNENESLKQVNVQLCYDTKNDYDYRKLNGEQVGIEMLENILIQNQKSRKLVAMNRRHYSHRVLSDLGEYDFNPRVRAWEYAYEEGVNSEHGCVGALEKISIVEDDSGLWEEIQLDFEEVSNECILSILSQLSEDARVCSIEADYQASPLNVYASVITQGGDYLNEETIERPWFDAGITGKNQIVAVSDSGVDMDHCYFFDSNPLIRDGSVDESQRKLIQYVPTRKGDNTDVYDGHGTHVAATVMGKKSIDGTSSGESEGMIDGVARDARLAFFDMGNGSNCCTFPSATVLLSTGREGVSKKAGVMNMSWGTGRNQYDGKARKFDQYMYDNDEFLTVAAAGNYGMKDGISHIKETVGSPAISKNGIAVGASQSTGKDIYTGAMLGADYLACFSSRGPAEDGRMKPDIVAPGFFILSAKAIPEQSGECDPEERPSPDGSKDGVSFKAGTSMASPVVTGSVALVRQYFEDGFYPSGKKDESKSFSPSAALIKAVIFNGGQDMEGAQDTWFGSGSIPVSPYDNHVGYGRVNLLNSLPLHSFNNFRVHVVDRTEIYNHEEHFIHLYVDTTECSWDYVSVTMAWTDPPSETGCTKCLLNDLDLSIELNGDQYLPNGLTSKDRLNNNERIRLNVEQGDELLVSVKAHNLSTETQQYSFVAAGCISITETKQTKSPSDYPTTSPTPSPTPSPTKGITSYPSQSNTPTLEPSIVKEDTSKPSHSPSIYPSNDLTLEPTIAKQNTLKPSHSPSTHPSKTLTLEPTIAKQNTPKPSYSPSTYPSNALTLEPTIAKENTPPSHSPSTHPSNAPTIENTPKHSHSPSIYPSDAPTLEPTIAIEPTTQPYTGYETITTSFSGNSESNGNMFRIRSREVARNLIIKRIDIHMPARGEKRTIEIYSKEGVVEGYQRRPGAWTLVGSATNVVGRGFGEATPLPIGIFEPILLPAGDTRSFYVTSTGGKLAYTKGNGTSNPIATTDNLELFEGYARKYSFSGANIYGRFDGSIIYEIEDIDNQPSLQPTKMKFPTSTPTMKPTEFPSISVPILPSTKPTEISPDTPTTGNLRSLTTTYDGESLSHGAMFNIFSKKDLKILNFSINTLLSDIQVVQIYHKPNIYQGYERRPGAWSLIAEFEVQCLGAGAPTVLPLDAFEKISILEGEVNAFYITFVSEKAMYTSANHPADDDIDSNEDIVIQQGVGKSYRFKATFQNRRWNGAVHYEVLNQ